MEMLEICNIKLTACNWLVKKDKKIQECSIPVRTFKYWDFTCIVM